MQNKNDKVSNTSSDTVNSQASTATNTSLFEVTQRKFDGKFEVWIQRTELELCILDADTYEAAGRPAFMNPPRWVILAVYDKRPTVDTVLERLGIKRKVTPKFAGTNQAPRSRTPRKEVEAV